MSLNDLVINSAPGPAADFEDSVGGALLGELLASPLQAACSGSVPEDARKPHAGSPKCSPTLPLSRRGSPRLTISTGTPADFEDSVGLNVFCLSPKHDSTGGAGAPVPGASPSRRASLPRCGTPSAGVSGSLSEVGTVRGQPRVASEALPSPLLAGPSADFEDSVGFMLAASPKHTEELLVKGGGNPETKSKDAVRGFKLPGSPKGLPPVQGADAMVLMGGRLGEGGTPRASTRAAELPSTVLAACHGASQDSRACPDAESLPTMLQLTGLATTPPALPQWRPTLRHHAEPAGAG